MFLGLVVLGIVGLVGWKQGWFTPTIKAAEVIAVNDLPPLSYDKNANAPNRPLPDTNQLSEVGAPFVLRAGIMGWNAQSGVAYANGGVYTTKGSLMEEKGVRLQLICQNNCNKQGEELFAFIQDYAAGNKLSSKGYHMIAWMGDGVPSYLPGLNERIKKQFGPEYQIKVFSGFGASFGEDKAIYKNGAFKNDPQKLRGSFWCGVIRDGDWNILMKYAHLNNIPVNNDLTTFDVDAINWMAAPENDYVKAAQEYVAGRKETRKLISKGKLLGRDTTVALSGCVTWFPGDKIAFEGRGGVTVASTKEYGAQMINSWLACDKWLQDNSAYIEKFIEAGLEGGDQVKSHSSALKFASIIQDKIYQDASMSAKDWEEAFKGIKFTDPNSGLESEIGGSRVFNLADAAEYYGLNNSGVDKYQAVYTTFGDLCKTAYPEELPTYIPYEEAVNLTFLRNVYNRKKATLTTVASRPEFKEGAITNVAAKREISIEFDFGSDRINAKSYHVLEQLAKDLIITEGLRASIEGHTDNVGNPEKNLDLSTRRANAVKQWLLNKYPGAFQGGKIQSSGLGDTQPVADNNTDAGRQKNRRVEIKLGN